MKIDINRLGRLMLFAGLLFLVLGFLRFDMVSKTVSLIMSVNLILFGIAVISVNSVIREITRGADIAKYVVMALLLALFFAGWVYATRYSTAFTTSHSKTALAIFFAHLYFPGALILGILLELISTPKFFFVWSVLAGLLTSFVYASICVSIARCINKLWLRLFKRGSSATSRHQ